MYFAVNTAFINYLDKFPNLTESLEFLILRNKTTFEQILPISLNISKFDSTLLTASNDLKEFIERYTNHKEIFDMQERHDNMELNTNQNFLSGNYIMDIFLFIVIVINVYIDSQLLILMVNGNIIRVINHYVYILFFSSQRVEERWNHVWFVIPCDCGLWYGDKCCYIISISGSSLFCW